MANTKYRVVDLLGQRCEVFRVRFGTESFRRHYHDTYSLGLIDDGANVFTYRRRVVEVPAGSICIAEPGEVHDGGLGGRPWAYRSMLFPAAVFDALHGEEYSGGDLSFPPGIIVDRELSSLLNLLFAEVGSPSAVRTIVEERAVTFFSKLLHLRCDRIQRRRENRVDIRAARTAMEYIADRAIEGCSLSDLARVTGKSKYAVIRAVSAISGMTPMQYLIQQRVARAKALLERGEAIAEVAYRTGFADQAHLTRRLRAIWGVTPGTIRRAAAGNG